MCASKSLICAFRTVPIKFNRCNSSSRFLNSCLAILIPTKPISVAFSSSAVISFTLTAEFIQVEYDHFIGKCAETRKMIEVPLEPPELHEATKVMVSTIGYVPESRRLPFLYTLNEINQRKAQTQFNSPRFTIDHSKNHLVQDDHRLPDDYHRTRSLAVLHEVVVVQGGIPALFDLFETFKEFHRVEKKEVEKREAEFQKLASKSKISELSKTVEMVEEEEDYYHHSRIRRRAKNLKEYAEKLQKIALQKSGESEKKQSSFSPLGDWRTWTTNPQTLRKLAALRIVSNSQNDSQEVSYEVKLGSRANIPYQLKGIGMGIADALAWKHNPVDRSEGLEKIGGSIAMLANLFTNQLTGMIVLADHQLNPHHYPEHEYIYQLSNQRCEVYFEPYYIQLNQIRKEYKGLCSGDIITTRHSSLGEVHVLFHIIVDDLIEVTEDFLYTALSTIIILCEQYSVRVLKCSDQFGLVDMGAQWVEKILKQFRKVLIHPMVNGFSLKEIHFYTEDLDQLQKTLKSSFFMKGINK